MVHYFGLMFSLLVVSLNCLALEAGVDLKSEARQVLQQNDTSTQVVRAQLIASDEVVISTGLTGKLASLNTKAGEYVAKGSVLAEFDCETYQASFDIAQAKVEAAQARYDSSQQLFTHNAVGPLEVQLNKAELAMAQGEFRATRSEIRYCNIIAPFDAVVVKRFVNAHQFVSKGEPLLELYSPHNLEVYLVVPSIWLKWLKEGLSFNLFVDEIDESFMGSIHRIGGIVDTVSQTVEVYGVIERGHKISAAQSSLRLLPGMSGTVQFDRKQL